MARIPNIVELLFSKSASTNRCPSRKCAKTVASSIGLSSLAVAELPRQQAYPRSPVAALAPNLPAILNDSAPLLTADAAAAFSDISLMHSESSRRLYELSYRIAVATGRLHSQLWSMRSCCEVASVRNSSARSTRARD